MSKINEMKKWKEGEENENNNERFYGITDGCDDRGGNDSYTQQGKEGYLLQDPKDLSSDKEIQNSKDNEENQKSDRAWQKERKFPAEKLSLLQER